MKPTAQETAGGRPVQVPANLVLLEGNLLLPGRARGVVLFAHGSGSSRFSPRNRHVADILQGRGLGSLLLDLLTPEEEEADQETAHLRFDMDLLATRLVSAVDWLREHPDTGDLGLACFGASTGGGAALVAAAERPDAVAAVVARGGRPDLAGDALARVRAPTLLIVGGEDIPVLEVNQWALAELGCEKHLEVIPGASHLFHEPGALDRVAELAGQWIERHLAPRHRQG